MKNFNLREAGIAAQKQVISEMKAGTFSPIEWDDSFSNGTSTISEMIGTADGAIEFVEKITYDVAASRALVPLLYTDIYTSITDPNFPLVLVEEQFGLVQAVFLEKFEGGEIKFGAMGPGTEKVVRFHTWATGMEYSEDVVEYNQTWRVSDISAAFGQSYQWLLNHLHLSAIFQGTYDNTTNVNNLYNSKLAQYGNPSTNNFGTAQWVQDTTFLGALQRAMQILPDGSKILCSPLDQITVEHALAADMLADFTPGIAKSKFSVDDFIFYNGAVTYVGGKQYTYPPVPQGEFYLIAAGQGNFKEYIKHDVRIDGGDGDLSRLIVTQLVARARRALLAILGGRFGAVKFTVGGTTF
jgi:hypothetical protein